MEKFKFVEEFEINASPKRIYPYLQNAISLSEWFIGKVEMKGQHIYNFIWDNTDHYAKLALIRLNKQVKFEFLDENQKTVDNPNYLDFRLQQSELTDSTYIKITDYSDMTDADDLHDLWKNLISQLKEVIGA